MDEKKYKQDMEREREEKPEAEHSGMLGEAYEGEPNHASPNEKAAEDIFPAAEEKPALVDGELAITFRCKDEKGDGCGKLGGTNHPPAIMVFMAGHGVQVRCQHCNKLVIIRRKVEEKRILTDTNLGKKLARERNQKVIEKVERQGGAAPGKTLALPNGRRLTIPK